MKLTNLAQPAKKVSAARVECQTYGKDYANEKNLKTHIDHKPTPAPEDVTNRAVVPGVNDNNSAAPFIQTDDELNAENEMMVEFAKQLDMLEEIKELTQKDKEDDEHDDLKKDISEHLERFKTIVIKKNAILKETREDKLKFKHEAECSKQVESNMAKDIEAKDIEIVNLKKELKVEKDNSISVIAESKNKKKEVKNLKVVIDARNKEIAELQEKLKSDDVSVVSVDTGGTGRVRMDKESSGPTCLPCDRRFVKESDLENHINAKHQAKKCPICDECFNTKPELISHLNSCMGTDDNSQQVLDCDWCHKKVNKVDIRNHKKNGSCTPDKRQIVCRQCRAICTSNDDLKKHIADDHEEDISKEVCKHWRAGHCFKGSQCKFKHVGYQEKAGTSRASTTPCRNGSSCAWLKRGKCKFTHQEERSKGVRKT